MMEEMIKRQIEAENIAKQKHRDKHLLNKDLLDFAHPDMRMQANSHDGMRRRSPSPESDEAEVMVDKKQILREMQAKRKQKELEKLREKEIVENKKKLELAKLENFLKQQKEEFLQIHQQQMEMLQKEAEKQKKMMKKAAKQKKDPN